METISYRHTPEKNKEIIIRAIAEMSPAFKSHVKEKVNRHYHTCDMFDILFKQLHDSKTIRYQPYCHIVILEKSFLYLANHINCPYCNARLCDQTEGLGRSRLYKCLDCKAVYHDGAWATANEWKEFIKHRYQTTTKNLTTHISP